MFQFTWRSETMVLTAVFRWLLVVFLLGAKGQFVRVPEVITRFSHMAVDTTNGASQLFQDTISVITGNIGTTIKQNIRQIGQMSLDRAGAVKGQEGELSRRNG